MAFLFRSTDHDDAAEYNQPDDDALSTRKPDALMKKEEQRSCWDTAHQQTCASLNSIIATPRQVLESESSNTVNERPDVKHAVSWKNETQAVEAVSKRLLELQQEASSTQKTSTSASWISLSAVSAPVSWLFQKLTTDITGDGEDWKQDDDEHDAVARTLVDWDEPVLNVLLAAESCQAILSHLRVGAIPRVFKREGDDPDACFYGRCHSFSKLPNEQLAFLAQVLIATNCATVQDDCIVLHKDLNGDVDTAVASFQLQQAIKAVETKVDDWVVQIQHCQQTALAMKRANKPTSQILRELKKKKLLEQHVESARMALLNLEQTQSTLDTATSQVEIVKLLHVSRDTWRNMQGEVTSEQVDEMVFDLQEEMELGTELNAVLATTTGGYRLNEEDALLEELESLTLSESRSKDQTTRNVQTTQHLEATVVAADMVEVASMEDTHERPSQSASNAKPCTAENPTLAS